MKIDQKRVVIGSALALISASTFALNMVCAGISYQHGANIHALNFARASVFLGCLLVAVMVTRVKFTMPLKARLTAIFTGVLLCSLMYTLLGAVRTIPVAIAILIFYTYPILLAIYGWLRGGETFSLRGLSLMVIAFIGLMVVLANGSFELEIEGTTYAMGAAVVMAVLLTVSESNMVKYNTFMVMSQVVATVVVILLLLKLILVDHHWPDSQLGWLAFSGSTALYVVATFTLFKAVSLVGPLRTAIIDNTAPVWAVIFGYVLLGQTLTAIQIFGATMVIGAVMLLQKNQ